MALQRMALQRMAQKRAKKAKYDNFENISYSKVHFKLLLENIKSIHGNIKLKTITKLFLMT